MMTENILLKKATFTNIAGALRFDYKPVKPLRLIAGIRADQYNHTGDLYYSYQFSASYKVNPGLLIRSTYSRANSGSYIGNTNSNWSVNSNLNDILGTPAILNIQYLGNKNLDVFLTRMLEVGFRAKLTDFLQVDLDLFTQGGSNMLGMIRQPQEIIVDPDTGLPTIRLTRTIENTDTHIRMNGLTFSANVALPKMLIKPFITYQHSQLTDFNRYQLHPEVDPVNNADIKTDKKHDATPDYYGGIYFNYNPVKKLNINFSPYFYGGQRQYHEHENMPNNNSNIGEIPGKLQVNGRIGYQVFRGADVFLSFKNLLGQNKREYYGADEIGALYFGGINFDFY